MLLKVEFLNSVIVDMQRKNDDLKTKLELYESAGILDESVDLHLQRSVVQVEEKLFPTGF